MPKLIPFPAAAVARTRRRLLMLSAPSALPKQPRVWAARPEPPEALGAMLQRLAIRRPLAVVLLANIVAEMLDALDEP